MLKVKWSTEPKYKKRYMVRDVLRAKVYTYGVWRMLKMLVKGYVEGGGLMCVLLVQQPSLAHGCRRMEGLEVLISGDQVSQRL